MFTYKIENVYEYVNYREENRHPPMIKFNNNLVTGEYVLKYIETSNWLKEQFSMRCCSTLYNKYKNRIFENIKLNFLQNKKKYEEESFTEALNEYEKNYSAVCENAWIMQAKQKQKVCVPSNGWYYLKKAQNIIDISLREIKDLESFD